MRICVFCSSAEGLAPSYVEAAREVGRLIGQRGHELVFGGFETGTMGEVARAAKAAGARVAGAIVGKKGELAGRPVFACDLLHESPALSRRKLWMEEYSDAFVVLPGSYGTLDEFYDVVSEQKMAGAAGKPVVLVNVEGFWNPLLALDERMVAEGFMDARCRKLYRVAETPREAMDLVESPKEGC